MWQGYLDNLLRLTLLAPDVVEAVLNGQQVPGFGLPCLSLGSSRPGRSSAQPSTLIVSAVGWGASRFVGDDGRVSGGRTGTLPPPRLQGAALPLLALRAAKPGSSRGPAR